MAGRKTFPDTQMKIFAISIFVMAAQVCIAEDSQDVISALLNFSRALKGQSVLNSWNPDTDPCKWTGITCKDRSHVSHVVLEGFQLSGTIDANTLCQVKSLRVFSLENNNIQGQLPADLSKCTDMKRIYLGNNRLTGPIPEELAGLKRLEVFDVSNNNLTGPLPPFDVAGFKTFNVAGNAGLCGGAGMPNCSTDDTSGPSKGSGRRKNALQKFAMWAGYVALFVALAFVFCFVFMHRRKYLDKIEAKVEKVRSAWSGTRSKASTSSASSSTTTPQSRTKKSPEFSTSVSSEYAVSTVGSKSTSLVFLDESRKAVKFEELLRASAELLGRGGLGSLYRVVMYDGSTWVVKRIRDIRVSRPDFERRMAEVGKLKHPNVLPLVAFYCSKAEKLLVYDHMPNGSISTLLHGRFDDKKLDWQTRLSVACGVAHGLAYLHDRNPSVPHANLKSSNVLLNEKYQPCISEYGLSFLLDDPAGISPGQWSGYKAPEYNQTKKFTQKSDVYSFGIMLLELLTGKEVDNSGLDLPRWVHSVVREEWTVEVFDKSMVEGESHVSEDRMVALLQIAVNCVSNNPGVRPSMVQVAKIIDKLKDEEERSVEQSYLESYSTSASNISGNATPSRISMSTSM